MPTLAHSIRELIYDKQHKRILRLAFPNNDAPPAQFLVNKIDASECLSKDFEFVVELISDNASLALKEMHGKLLNIELVRQDGSLRYFSGYVLSFQRCHSDGSITFYEAKLGPWLKFLNMRKNSYLFQGKKLRDQTEDILKNYGSHAQWDWRVTSDDPVITDACQFNETDFNYLSRRWESAGWYYWYEHNAKGHKLVISSDSTYAPPIDGDSEVRFHGKGGSVEEDSIGQWSPVRQAVPSSVTLSGFDFKDPLPICVGVPTLNKQDNFPQIEYFEYTGAYGFRNFKDGDAQSRIRMEEFEAVAKFVEAQGNDRFLMPGRWFRLINHFNHNISSGKRDTSKDEFLILSVRHTATNNYLQQDDEKVLYLNQLICTRKDIPWRPSRSFNSTDTKIFAPQTAIVVGPTGQESIYTDDYGRVKVQFHWDREGKRDESSSAWIRVTSLWAGAELGAAAIPRIGTEVIVQWLNGCPDRPIITGAVFNERNMPPWKIPTQHALTGLRSRELVPGAGNSPSGRGNHLILDDTNEKIQAQLKSDHQCSQLSLGHITRIENNAGCTDLRGEGWELATNAWGVARAGQGMLLTTEARQNAALHITDLGETAERLASAAEIQEQLASVALDHGAQEIGQQDEAVDDVKAQNSAILGESKGSFPELSEPHLVIASPAGIELTSALSTHFASKRHTVITSGKSLSIGSADSLFASVGKTIRLFAHKAGMKLISGAGKVSVQAHSDDVEIIANKVLEMLSETDWVNIRGKKGVRLHGVNNMVEIGDHVQFFTSSPVLFHGNLETLAAKSVSQAFNERSFDYQFDQEVNFVDANLKPEKNIAFELVRGDGTVMGGKTAASGSTEVQKSGSFDAYTIRYKGELP